METILTYLNNMFAAMPVNDETIRAKEELASMMEDKYNELIAEGKRENEAIGIVISEFGNIQELSEELGLGRKENEEWKESPKSEENRIKEISDQEAEEYLAAHKSTTPKIAFGVAMCIWSPIAVIVLAGLQEYVKVISEGLAVGIGISLLLLMIAGAVGIFIYFNSIIEKFDYLKKEDFVLTPYLEAQLKERKEQEKTQGNIKMIIGIVMCILSIIPIIVCACLPESDVQEFAVICAVGVLLMLVGIGVYLIIIGDGDQERYRVLLQEGDFSRQNKKNAKVIDRVASVYWSIMVAVYLGWSFISGRWDYTWIVWPVAGVFFGAVAAVFSGIKKGE